MRRRGPNPSIAHWMLVTATLVPPAACSRDTFADHSTSIPDLAMVFVIDGCPIDIDPLACGECIPLATGEFLFSGRYALDDLGAATWSMRVDPDPFVQANLAVVSFAATPSLFTLTVMLPTMVTGMTVRGGSIAGSVTDSSGDMALLSAPMGGAVYTSFVDNLPFPGSGLMVAPFSVAVPRFETREVGPAIFGAPIPALAGGPVTTNIGITLTFVLSPGDTAELTSTFVVQSANPIEGVAPSGEETEATIDREPKEGSDS